MYISFLLKIKNKPQTLEMGLIGKKKKKNSDVKIHGLAAVL